MDIRDFREDVAIEGLFDTHAHLLDEQFSEDRGALLSALFAKGMTGILECAAEGADIPRILDLVEEWPLVWGAAGIHAHSCDEWGPEAEAALRSALAHPKVLAVGEIGLDYHYDFHPRELQKEVLRAQLAIAREFDKPVVLHNRESTGDMLEVLREFAPLRGVMHCFSGSADTAREMLAMGLYIGFGGSLTFRNNKKGPEVARMCPADRLLLETDCPYLAPVPLRGTRNHPGNTAWVARTLAALRDTTPQDIIRQSRENAKALFGV